jgi:hypothetical protein
MGRVRKFSHYCRLEHRAIRSRCFLTGDASLPEHGLAERFGLSPEDWSSCAYGSGAKAYVRRVAAAEPIFRKLSVRQAEDMNIGVVSTYLADYISRGISRVSKPSSPRPVTPCSLHSPTTRLPGGIRRSIICGDRRDGLIDEPTKSGLPNRFGLYHKSRVPVEFLKAKLSAAAIVYVSLTTLRRAKSHRLPVPGRPYQNCRNLSAQRPAGLRRYLGYWDAHTARVIPGGCAYWLVFKRRHPRMFVPPHES